MLLLALALLLGCSREAIDYGFSINQVGVSRGYQLVNVRMDQKLDLSHQAREAVLHGVTLSIKLELELQSAEKLIGAVTERRRFEIRYLPLSERFQLTEKQSGDVQSFSRLRHALATIDRLHVKVATGPLPPGGYQLRTRIFLDERRLPAPMQLPAWFSSQWHHDSGWSVWPFKINA